MARVVLDTSILIALEKQELLMQAIFEKDNEYFLPEITVAEYLVGLELSKSQKIRSQRLSFLEALEKFSAPINFDRSTAVAYARLVAQDKQQGQPRGAFDLAIAACAVAKEAVLYTRDAKAKFDHLAGVTIKEF